MKVIYKRQLDIYPTKLWVIVTDDYRDANKLLETEDLDEDFWAHAFHHGVFDKEKGCKMQVECIVINPTKKNFPILTKTIAHEAVHAANNIMKKIGWKHQQHNDEPFAYLVGFIAQEVQDCLDEWKKKNGKI